MAIKSKPTSQQFRDGMDSIKWSDKKPKQSPKKKAKQVANPFPWIKL